MLQFHINIFFKQIYVKRNASVFIYIKTFIQYKLVTSV